ncbi:helix-turn-helix domain-containing protein [Microvirga sp. 2TAF3]|uniref:helix-turn-helix domain-containing protein n=1 Tax=Microvirga sp. 2TAF3 TaxID=3233014 RepID=UPI003F98A184
MGRYKGRGVSPIDRVREMKAAGHGSSPVAKELGISRMSVHRALKSHEART